MTRIAEIDTEYEPDDSHDIDRVDPAWACCQSCGCSGKLPAIERPCSGSWDLYDHEPAPPSLEALACAAADAWGRVLPMWRRDWREDHAELAEAIDAIAEATRDNPLRKVK